MILQQAAIRLFQRALMAWVLFFVLFSWTGIDGANALMRSPMWLPPGPLKFLTHAIAQFAPAGKAVAFVIAPWLLVVLAAWELWRPGRLWRALFVWWLYVNVMNAAWLTGSGGQQLIANVLFWNIGLAFAGEKAARAPVGYGAFWIIRLQLLLAYAATGSHKLMGTHWLDGTAMGIAATDPAYGPAWIADHSVIAVLATWCVLIFQLTFPIAVWWRPTRYAWMLFGALFHVGTALWMDIPEMGLAFIACYPIWFDERLAGRLRWKRQRAGS